MKAQAASAMKRKFIKDISASSLQVIINQLCGLVIFYILSAWLNKKDFGEINWSLAVLLTLFNMLSFGIDQIAVKKIASGKEVSSTISTYIVHVLFSGILVYALLILSTFIFSDFFGSNDLLLLIGIGKLMIFFSTPFKQLAIGLEKFRPLVLMSICSNVLRSGSLLFFALFNQYSIEIIVIIFIAGDLAELLLCIWLTKYHLKVPLSLQWNQQEYLSLLKESLPQLGVTIFTSAMARLDWIFLGILASNIIVANYSFAYKVFEVATVPLLIIAPLLIPRFTRIFKDGDTEDAGDKISTLLLLLKLEVIIAGLIALALNILWVPVIDFITAGKYGSVNKHTILILSVCMPFLYFNNFLWTISFAKGRLKAIFLIFLICFIVNLIATVALIPFLNGEGAAAAYLLAIIVQSVLFFKLCGFTLNSKTVTAMLISVVLAAGSGILASYLFNNPLLILAVAVIFYCSGLIVTQQISAVQLRQIKQLFHS
jgi:O-antigen/teichoic acid export membrane protein